MCSPSSSGFRSRRLTGPTSRTWRSVRGRWRGSSRHDLRPPAAPAPAGGAAPVVVAAGAAAHAPLGDCDGGFACGGRSSGAGVGRPASPRITKRVHCGVDHCRCGPAHGRSAGRSADRGDLDCDERRCVEQYAGRRLRALQPHGCGEADGDRVYPGAHLGPHRGRCIRRAGADPGSAHDRLSRPRGRDSGAPDRDAGRRHGNRHGNRDGGEPAAARARKNQGADPAHRRREQPRDCGPAHGGTGRVRVRHPHLHDRRGHAR